MNVWSVGFATAVLLFQLVSIPALILKKNDLADVLWGPAFFFSALAASVWGTPEGLSSISFRTILILGVLAIWATRLFIRPRPESGRN